MRLPILLAVAALATLPSVSAQTTGACAKGAATARLDAADVVATLSASGTLLWLASGERNYRVGTGQPATYAVTPSVGGRVGGDLRVTGGRYSGDFWPGPLGPGASLPADGCAPYDRIWTVSQVALAAYEQSGEASADLSEWPVGLGAPAVDAAGRTIETTDRTRRVDLAAGERPVVSGLQTAFWILNDVGNMHTQTTGAPLGVEVQVLAVVPADAALARTTVYRYRFVNRNTRPIEGFRSMLYADLDAGKATDDFVGSDSTRQMILFYDGVDGAAGDTPLAVGIDLLSGAESAPLLYKSASLVYFGDLATTPGY